MVSETDISMADVKRHVVECFSDLASTVGSGFQPSTIYADLERAEQEYLGREHINDLKEQIERQQFSPSIETYARASMERRGDSFDALTEVARSRMMEGIARAHIEADHYRLFRIHERLLKYKVQDPLLRKPWPWSPSPAALPSTAAPWVGAITVPVGPTVQELLDAYLKEKRPSWVPKTYGGVKRHLSYLIEVVGADTPLSAITKEQIRTLRDGATQLRLNHHVGPSKTFKGRQTDVVSHRVSSKTASAIVADASAFLKWSAQNGFRDDNPADGITVTAAKTKKGNKPRLPFSSEDLKKLFSAPLYTGCASRARRHDVGRLPKVTPFGAEHAP